MKKWENPQLSLLGIEKTKSAVCPICNGTTFKQPSDNNHGNQHYCHRDGVWHQNNCTSLNVGHFQSGSNCPNGGYHEWKGESHKSNCCCAGVTGGDNVEGLS